MFCRLKFLKRRLRIRRAVILRTKRPFPVWNQTNSTPTASGTAIEPGRNPTLFGPKKLGTGHSIYFSSAIRRLEPATARRSMRMDGTRQ